ncbi:MAG: DRTGG domain-containing protein [Clostridia bacterium]|nr:DRTGG domain-containing protein [Clostridia bacterium]
MATKHDLIIQYIMSLEPGATISVRKIARELKVSQGTAYRAIKEAENREYVKTFPRMGTIRVEKDEKRGIERLTFAEAATMVDGSVLGGRKGLNKTLSRFVIGAMTADAMEKYLSSDSLLIVGNREEAFSLAMEHNCAVLITGGFGCSDEIRQLADQKSLPVISSTYDTFTTATMINQAISDRLIKKEVLLVEDIMMVEPKYLYENDTIEKWGALFQESGHSRFPVLNQYDQVVGMLTPKDIHKTSSGTISQYMTANPLTVTRKTTTAYAAHIMIWEGIELLPVVEDEQLVGVISRQDVIKAIQYMKNQPQMGETLEDMVLSNFGSKRMENRIRFTGKVTPILTSHLGTASWSSMTMMMSTAAIVALSNFRQTDVVVDTFTVYFVGPLELGDILEIDVEPIEESRMYNKVEVSVYREKVLIAKAMLAAKAMRK